MQSHNDCGTELLMYKWGPGTASSRGVAEMIEMKVVVEQFPILLISARCVFPCT